MNIKLRSCAGVIAKIWFSNDKVVNKVQISLQINYPFKTLFHVFETHDPAITDGFKIGDEVDIHYEYTKDHTFELLNMWKTHLDKCPENQCFCYLQKRDYQRLVCPLCHNTPTAGVKQRTNELLQLTYLNEQGDYAEFLNKSNKHFKTQLIKFKNPLLDKMKTLKLLNWYTILAWRSNIGSDNILDVLDVTA